MAEPLKQFINVEAVRFLADKLAEQFSDFDKQRFQRQILPELDAISLTQRVSLLGDAIAKQLPADFREVAPGLHQLAANWPVTDNNAGWQQYAIWPLITYAGQAGINKPDLALPVLADLTPLFTAEFAIRPYLEQHFEQTYRQMLDWADHEDPHLRRLASEGLRPRLPWGIHLKHIPTEKALALLDKLKDDDSVYVQKSVANHLNDLSKTHPKLILDLCQSWQDSATPARQWIIRRALRTLQKQAEPAALKILGYSQDLPLSVDFKLSEKACRIGDSVTMQLLLKNPAAQPQSLLIDYELWLMRGNGRQTAKVFFWNRINLTGQQQIVLIKQQAMQQLSTRKLYPGEHKICLRINGQPQTTRIFQLMP